MSDFFTPRTIEDLEHEFPPQLSYISASSIKMAIRCEEQWRQVYVQKIRKPPSLSMLAGRADHAAIEHSMRQKIETFVDLPVNDVEQAYIEQLEMQVEDSGGLNEIETRADTQAGKVKEYDSARTIGRKAVAAYHRVASPLVQPHAVEEQFELPLNGLPVILTGYIDLIGSDAQALDPSPRIIDRKTSKRPSNKPMPEWVIQAEVYQLAYPYEHEWHVTGLTSVPSIILPGPSNPLRIPVANAQTTTRFVEQVVAKIGWLYQRYGPDAPWPTTGKLHPWACGYCGFRDNCWGWK